MHIFARVWRFIRPFRSQLLIAVALTGGMTLLGMLPPILMRYLIDDVVGMGHWNQAFSLLMAFLAVNLLAAGGIDADSQGGLSAALQ